MPYNYNVTDINFMSDLNELMDSVTAEMPEPSVEVKDSSGALVMSIKASGIKYNRDSFPHDTYQQAARRVIAIIKGDHTQIDFSFDLSQWSEFPKRTFSLNVAGLEHNFEVDTWHWWVLNELEKMVKKTPS